MMEVINLNVFNFLEQLIIFSGLTLFLVCTVSCVTIPQRRLNTTIEEQLEGVICVIIKISSRYVLKWDLLF
jgi:hypothetical protein